MNIQINYQNRVHPTAPTAAEFQAWADCVATSQTVANNWEVTIQIVSREMSQTLNREFRNKNKPTNVLSFPCEPNGEEDANYLGDIAICAQVVEAEAIEQGKPAVHYWAHMAMHGLLHLLGYDHINNKDAEVMEALEANLLATL